MPEETAAKAPPAPVVSDHPSRSLRFVTVEICRGVAKGPFTFACEDRMKLMDLLANGRKRDRVALLTALRESLKGGN